MASIDTFKGQFSEMARSNRFRVTGFGVDSGLEYMAKGAQLPGSTIGVMDVPYQGRVIKMSGDRTFNDFTMTIYNDDSMTLLKDFNAWVNLLNGEETNVGSTVKRDGKIEQLGRDGSVIATFSITGAIPIDVAAVDLAFDTNDTPSEFSVTLAYDYHTIA